MKRTWNRGPIGRGFTLIEALISIFLTVILLSSVIGIFTSISKAARLSANHHHGAIIGAGLLDEARGVGFDAVTPVSGSKTFNGVNNGQPVTQEFNYTTSIQAVSAVKKQIWATVSWREGSQNKQVVVETILAKY